MARVEMGILHRRLRDYLGKEIIVVMTDGRAFKGILTEFDESALVLREVLETATGEVRWRPPLVPIPTPRNQPEGEAAGFITLGDGERSYGRLKEVVISPAGILRVWLYQPEEYRPAGADDIGSRKV
ncbi:MAG: LSm family protein [Thermoplasmata archaeon]